MSNKKPKLDKKTILILAAAAIVIIALYIITARKGGDTTALTNTLVSTLVGDDTSFDVGALVSNSGQQGTQSDTSGDDNAIVTVEPQPTSEPTKAPTNEPTKKPTKAPTATPTPKPTATPTPTPANDYVTYRFRNKTLLTQHYEKHGIEMGFDSKESYEQAACDVINNPAALHKTEKEDGDFVYYVEETNEFVILSKDGYIRTYFLPNAGLAYYNRQ